MQCLSEQIRAQERGKEQREETSENNDVHKFCHKRFHQTTAHVAFAEATTDTNDTSHRLKTRKEKREMLMKNHP